MYAPIMEPDIPNAMGHLLNVGTDELKEILNDDAKFEEMIKDNKMVIMSVAGEFAKENLSDLESEKEVLMVRNRSLAEFNLTKKPEFEERKRELQSLSEEGNRLCMSVHEKLDQIQDKSGSMTVTTALDLLEAGAAEIEMESEEIANTFLRGDLEVDEFLEQFLNRRKFMHMRKVKLEKMKELMRKVIDSGPTSSPYPNGPMLIPMPTPYQIKQF